MSEDDFDDALNELESCIESLDGIEAAESFAASLAEKCGSMREWYEAHGYLTDAQVTAIENMIAGARRWLR